MVRREFGVTRSQSGESFLSLLRREEQRLGRDRKVRDDELRAVGLETVPDVEARPCPHAKHVLNAPRCDHNSIGAKMSTPKFAKGLLVQTEKTRFHRRERREGEGA